MSKFTMDGLNETAFSTSQATEKTLQATVDRLHLALAAADLGDWSWDAATDVVTLSQKAAGIFGIAPGPQMTWTVMQELLHEDDRERARGAVLQAVETREPYRIEYRVQRPRGDEVWVAAMGRAQYDDAGRAVGMFGVVQDISERKQTEEALRRNEAALRSLLDNTPSMMGVVELDANVADVLHILDNAYADRFFGVEPGGTAGKWAARDLGAQPETIEQWSAAYLQAKATGRPVRFAFAMDGPTPDGTPVESESEDATAELWMDVSVSYIGQGHHGRDRFCYTAINDTQRRKAEEEVLRLNRSLHERVNELQTLLDILPIGVWQGDRDCTHITGNRAGYEMLRLPYEINASFTPSPDKTADLGYICLLDGEEIPFDELPMQRAARTGEPVRDFEHDVVFEDGSFKALVCNVAPILDGDNQVQGVLAAYTDITARKQVEEALRESNEYLQRAQQAARLGTWDWDLTTNKINWSDGAYELIGAAPRSFEPTFNCWLEFILPEDVPSLQRELEKILEAAGDFTLEFRIRHRNGSIRWIASIGRVETTPSGEPHRLLGVNIDITERKAAEEQLRESESRFRTVADSSPVLMWLNEAKGAVFVNRAYLDFLGLSHQTDVSNYDWSQYVHPEDHDTYVETYLDCFARRAPFEAEFRFRRHDGQYRWMKSVGVPRFSGEQLIGYTGSTFDIHDARIAEQALRESELRFRQLADTVPQMVWVTRPDGHHEYFNRRWYEFTGVPQGSTDGQGWNGVFHPEDQPRSRERWQQSLETGEPYEIEYRLRHHSGEYRWTLGRALPIRNEHGEIERWFGTCTDIEDFKRLQTEREQLLESERAARLTAERESRLKDEFLATLSHELRTPLNAIMGWTELIGRGDLNAEDTTEGLRIIERNARTQAQLIEDLLDMSRIISGKIRLDVQSVNLHDVVEAACATVQPAVKARGVKLRKVLDPQAGPISGDPNRLQQVVWNLLSNAVKFTPRDGAVEVLLQRVNSHLEIVVTDSGEGIEPDFLPHVFDRFRQADGTTTRRHGGIGLGLSIVKHLVDLHGGAVRAESAGKGRGATFTVALPLASVQQSEYSEPRRHPVAGPVHQSGSDSAPRLDEVRVIVVDDDADARDLVRRVLENAGAQTFLAASANEAMELLQGASPAVLISDIGMPETDGYELIRRVRALPKSRGGQTPAIALTAFARSEDRRRAIASGYQMHLAKPVDSSELVTMIASLAGLIGGSLLSE